MLDKILQFIAEKLKCLPTTNGGTGVTTADDIIKTYGFRTKTREAVLIGKNLTNGKNIYAYDWGEFISGTALDSNQSFLMKTPKMTANSRVLYSYFDIGLDEHGGQRLPIVDIRNDVTYYTQIDRFLCQNGKLEVTYKNNYPSWGRYGYKLYGFVVFESEV